MEGKWLSSLVAAVVFAVLCFFLATAQVASADRGLKLMNPNINTIARGEMKRALKRSQQEDGSSYSHVWPVTSSCMIFSSSSRSVVDLVRFGRNDYVFVASSLILWSGRL